MRPPTSPNGSAPTLRGAGHRGRPERAAADAAKLLSIKQNPDFAMLAGTR
jgi:hypothetical protein